MLNFRLCIMDLVFGAKCFVTRLSFCQPRQKRYSFKVKCYACETNDYTFSMVFCCCGCCHVFPFEAYSATQPQPKESSCSVPQPPFPNGTTHFHFNTNHITDTRNAHTRLNGNSYGNRIHRQPNSHIRNF